MLRPSSGRARTVPRFDFWWLVSVDDGFCVDRSPPSLTLDRTDGGG